MENVQWFQERLYMNKPFLLLILRASIKNHTNKHSYIVLTLKQTVTISPPMPLNVLAPGWTATPQAANAFPSLPGQFGLEIP